MFVVWLDLSLISVIQLWLSGYKHMEPLRPDGVITVSVLALALIKVRFRVSDFMELRHAPVLFRRLADAWLLTTALALLGTYFVGSVL